MEWRVDLGIDEQGQACSGSRLTSSSRDMERYLWLITCLALSSGCCGAKNGLTTLLAENVIEVGADTVCEFHQRSSSGRPSSSSG